MASMILKKVALIRKGKRGKGSDYSPMDAPAAADARGQANDASAQDHTLQEAHDQVVEGLTTIEEKYPDAGDILKEFEQTWTRWMSGKAGPQKAEGVQTGPEAPQDETSQAELQNPGDGLKALSRMHGQPDEGPEG